MSKAEDVSQNLRRVYPSLLRRHLETGGEDVLMEAYNLGRDAVSNGVSVLTLITTHQEAVEAEVREVTNMHRSIGIERRAARLLQEALGPFEMAFRGFEEALTSLRHLNELLEVRVAERTKQLQEAVRIRDDFLMVASHELRTPLAALTLQVERLLRRAEAAKETLPPWIIESGERISRSSQRMLRLINQVLDATQVLSKRVRLEPERVDLARITQDVADQFAEQLKQAGCKLEIQADPVVLGFWDPLRLEQVVSNLLANALKFGPGKPIQVTVTGEEDGATLVVRDQGIGMSLAEQQQIFQRFARVAPTRQYGGLGIGLWLVREFVTAMGGTVNVTSQPGQGSTFTVQLPRRPLYTATPPAE